MSSAYRGIEKGTRSKTWPSLVSISTRTPYANNRQPIMKTSILALFLSQLVSLSEQSPVTTDLAVTRAPTQFGALSNCSSWYIATPGDDCNTLLSMIGVTDVARDSGNLYSLNPQIHDCWHDVWAGYRYCLKSEPISLTLTREPSLGTDMRTPLSARHHY